MILVVSGDQIRVKSDIWVFFNQKWSRRFAEFLVFSETRKNSRNECFKEMIWIHGFALTWFFIVLWFSKLMKGVFVNCELWIWGCYSLIWGFWLDATLEAEDVSGVFDELARFGWLSMFESTCQLLLCYSTGISDLIRQRMGRVGEAQPIMDCMIKAHELNKWDMAWSSVRGRLETLVIIHWIFLVKCSPIKWSLC